MRDRAARPPVITEYRKPNPATASWNPPASPTSNVPSRTAPEIGSGATYARPRIRPTRFPDPTISRIQGRSNAFSVLARTEKAFDLPWIREIVGSGKRVGRILGRAYVAPDPISGAVRDGTLLVGEAGGFQDAVAGFGFRYSVITGGLAARSLMEGSDYRALLRATFGLEFQQASAMREKMNHATNDDYDRMIGALGPEISLKEYMKGREARGF